MPNKSSLPGVKPYADSLPNWAKAIDVCIPPYKQTSLNLQSSPLKLREYLASGKPIVAVPLPEAKPFGNVVQTAEDGPGFVLAIEKALAENTPELVTLRQKAVDANTCDATVEKVMEKLEAELSKRHKSQAIA